MKALILIFLMNIYQISLSQSFKILDELFTTSEKPLMIYSIAAWCAGNIEDLNSIKDTLIKYRNRYTLVLLLDSSNNKKYSSQRIIDLLKPDKHFVLNHFFSNKLKTKAERNTYTAYLNNLFSENFKQVGAGALIVSKNRKTIVLPLLERSRLISEWLGSP